MTEPSDDEPGPHHSMDDSYRMDILMKVVSADRSSGEIQYVIYPDPKRYEWREEKGERLLYDRFDQLVIPQAVVMDMLARSQKIKPLAQPQLLGNAFEYVAKRGPTIRQRLAGELASEALADVASTVLEGHMQEKHAYVALVVDLVGSTKLARSIDTADMARLVRVLSDEMSVLLQPFYGHVLKYTGDGLIAFFAAPNFIRMNDHALDCAVTLRRLVYYGLNPALEEWGYRPVEIRIGIEGGEGVAVALGSPDTKRSIDLVGDFINMAAKLQALAPPGGIYVGYVSERNLHVDWRQQLKRISLPDGWEYRDAKGNPYAIFAAPDLESDSQSKPPG
jgi:class 3 adenylate cyclase